MRPLRPHCRSRFPAADLASRLNPTIELGEALIVNPYDRMAITEAMQQGLLMPLQERREPWGVMMKTLRCNDSTSWRDAFVRGLSEVAA